MYNRPSPYIFANFKCHPGNAKHRKHRRVCTRIMYNRHKRGHCSLVVMGKAGDKNPFIKDQRLNDRRGVKKHGNHASPAIIMYHYGIVRNNRVQGFPRVTFRGLFHPR